MARWPTPIRACRTSCSTWARTWPRRSARATIPDWALRVTDAQVARLEAEIDGWNADLPALTSFILPGGSAAVAGLHTARAVTRRAERAAVAAKGDGGGTRTLNPAALAYLNRSERPPVRRLSRGGRRRRGAVGARRESLSAGVVQGARREGIGRAFSVLTPARAESAESGSVTRFRSARPELVERCPAPDHRFPLVLSLSKDAGLGLAGGRHG